MDSMPNVNSAKLQLALGRVRRHPVKPRPPTNRKPHPPAIYHKLLLHHESLDHLTNHSSQNHQIWGSEPCATARG